jgi:short-subunit dehydrogenase
MKLKPVSEQNILITGATSGIGLTTARMAADKGASVALIARNFEALADLSNEINNQGGKAVFYAADVADEQAMRKAGRYCADQLGGIDTWVNNAGGSIYGRLMDVPLEDFKRLFETNLWGVVNGSRIAVEYLRENGGAIINLGSEVSDSPIPLQGMYSASKHAVKGFTDSLRMELEADGLPISVTLIKPTAIHTPFTEHAKNYLPYEPQLPQPLYAPELVAEAILHCAENQVRDFFVGETAKLSSARAYYAPGLSSKLNEAMIDSFQNSGRPAEPDRDDGLYQSISDLSQRGHDERFVFEESIYQRAMLHPFLAMGLLVVGAAAVAAILNRNKNARHAASGDRSQGFFQTQGGF